MGCPHDHMKFEEGTFRIFCIDCRQEWDAVRGGMPDLTLKLVLPAPFRDTRHDRYVTPRTEPQPVAPRELKVTWLKKR